MPIVRDNTRVIKRLIDAKIAAGLSFAAREGADQYRSAVIEKTHDTYPTGPFKPPHSRPGEYPDRETGQGHENIAWELRGDNRAAAYGVKGPLTGTGPKKPTHGQRGGLHLIWLTGAKHRRKGPVDIFHEHKFDLLEQFREGMRNIR